MRATDRCQTCLSRSIVANTYSDSLHSLFSDSACSVLVTVRSINLVIRYVRAATKIETLQNTADVLPYSRRRYGRSAAIRYGSTSMVIALR